MNLLKNYIKNKWLWVDKNPRKAAWISWIKGLITGLILSFFI